MNVVFLVFMVKGNTDGVRKVARVALVVAVLVLCVDAWIFEFTGGHALGIRPLWRPSLLLLLATQVCRSFF